MADQKVLLKQLVDAPFGKAEAILREKGLWDEKRVPKDQRKGKDYEVTLIGMQPVSATVTVFAKNETEARQMAMDEVEGSDWEAEWRADIEDISVDTVAEVEE